MFNFIVYHTPIFYLIQSVWRDEAFSYFMAKPGLIKIIFNTAHDFNPPLYYILLHFWIYPAGHGDEFLRLLSFVFHLGGVYIAYLFGEKFFSKKFAVFSALFYFLNPMLLYYAFEMRMYSLYAFLTICSLYFFHSKKWRLYILGTVLGLYTHSFFILIPISFTAYLLITGQTNKKNIIKTLLPLVFFIPWIPVLAIQFLNSKNSWLFPVDIQLILSVLGNLFTGYEGTPGNLWGYTAVLSGVIAISYIWALRKKKTTALLLVLPVIIPLGLILGYSVLRRPLFVNRYVIFVTVFEVMGISLTLFLIKNRRIQNILIIICILTLIFWDTFPVAYRKKTDFKSTFAEINRIAKPSDYAYAKTPIGYLETAYYYKYPKNAYIYNPQNVAIPNYIGVTVVFPDASRSDFPQEPSKTFLIDDGANYEILINK